MNFLICTARLQNFVIYDIINKRKIMNGDKRMSGNNSIKTTLFGGFDKKQVDEYLDALRLEYEKAANADEYSELNAELSRLRAELDAKNAQIFDLKKTIGEAELNDESSSEASQLDALASSTEMFAQAHGEVVKIAEETGSYIKSTGKKLPNLLERLSALSEKIEAINGELAQISAEFDDICPASPTDKPAEAAEEESFFDIFAEHEDELNQKINALNPLK